MADEKRCDLCIAPAYIYGTGIKLCRTHYDELEAWNRAWAAQLTDEAGGPISQRCPRRDEMFQQGDGEDEWRIRIDAYGKPERICTYCGSMHPDEFMQAIKDGREIGPTDKNYKAYVGPNHGKFYFQHLSDEQRREFVELLNANTMNVGYPGHFYRLPFFCVRGS